MIFTADDQNGRGTENGQGCPGLASCAHPGFYHALRYELVRSPEWIGDEGKYSAVVSEESGLHCSPAETIDGIKARLGDNQASGQAAARY